MLLWAGRKDVGCKHCSSSPNICCVQRFYLSVTWEVESPQSLRVNISSKESGEIGGCNLWKIMGLIRPDETVFQPGDQCYFSEVRRWPILEGRFSALIVFHCGKPTGTNIPSVIFHGLQSTRKLSPCLSMGYDEMSYWHMDVKCRTNIRTKAFRQA